MSKRCIVGIMIALILIILLSVYFAGRIERNEIQPTKAAKIQIRELCKKVYEFRRHCGRFPTKAEGLMVIYQRQKLIDCKDLTLNWNEDKNRVLNDPWSNEYFYESFEKAFRIWTSSPEGKLIEYKHLSGNGVQNC